jgi:hypothetical protein
VGHCASKLHRIGALLQPHELLRTNGIDCVFASPIATMAPLWEALAARRERGEPEVPRYFRGHFFAAAAEAMRRILLNRARDKKCLKRGVRSQRVDLERLAVVDDASDGDLMMP